VGLKSALNISTNVRALRWYPGLVTGTTSERVDKRRRGTREAILHRAIDVARAEGLEALTIGRLAADMQMSKSGLFGHFGSKEELQLATVDAAARIYLEQVIQPALEVAEGRERLEALCEHYLSHLEEQSGAGGCFWAGSAAEFDDRPGPVRDRIQQLVGAWVSLLAREAESAGAQDPEQLGFELHSMVMGANLRAQLLGDASAFDRARAAISRLLA
jgi:AcrR family transcriptional regulator